MLGTDRSGTTNDFTVSGDGIQSQDNPSNNFPTISPNYMPFDDPSILMDLTTNQASIVFSADVIAYTGVVEAVELYYNFGDGFIPIEMQEEEGLGGHYYTPLTGLYNGMIIEYDALKVMQKGSTFELHIDNSSLGYSLDGDDEIVAWGKFNS